MKSSHRVAAYALCVVASSGLFGCVTSDEDPVVGGGGMSSMGGGTANTGGSGTTGTGGRAGGMGGASSGQGGGGSDTAGAVACPTPMAALITDFSPPAPAAAGDAGVVDAGPSAPVTGISWGDFTTQFSGSTYQYPNQPTDMYTLPADF